MATAKRTAGAKPGAVTVHPGVAGDAAVARAAFRLSIQYLLRSLWVSPEDRTEDNPLTRIVLYGIIAGNQGHLDDPNSPSPYSALDVAVPDELRRPVSTLAVANSLGLPYETTRRHVQKLIALGRCQRVKGGLIMPAAAFARSKDQASLLANVANLRRLYTALKRAGLELE